MNLKKIRLQIENFVYAKRYKKNIDLNQYKIETNNFSGRPLNVLMLFHTINTFAENNIIAPVKELGNVFVYELTPVAHPDDWYLLKNDANQRMLEYVAKLLATERIDVIMIYITGHGTNVETLKVLRSYGIPIVSESYDDERKFRSRKGKDGIYRGMKDVCRYFDVSMTTSKSAIVKYLVEGGKPIYKDLSGNEKIYRNLHLEKEYDVVFIGADYGIRRKYVEYLRQNGIDVWTKGEGWKEGFASSEEMIEMFNKAKIVLGFSTVGKNDDIFILKGRDVEVPFTGSFYLTGYHDELKEYFELGKDLETYRSKEDLLDKVRFYLEHNDERESIARHGYEKCISQFTATVAYAKVFGYLGL